LKAKYVPDKWHRIDRWILLIQKENMKFAEAKFKKRRSKRFRKLNPFADSVKLDNSATLFDLNFESQLVDFD